ncbi:hypothetical protein Cfor_01974, partial [Coptotermes formosanus]
MAAYRAIIHRMHKLPLSEAHRKAELDTIMYMAKRSGFSSRWINRINSRIISRNTEKQEERSDVCSTENPNWVTFRFHSPLIWKVPIIFKTFRSSNTLNNLLNPRPHVDKYEQSGICELKSNTCRRVYVGQSGTKIHFICKEHHRYIRQNSAKSAYAVHILSNQHECGPMMSTM